MATGSRYWSERHYRLALNSYERAANFARKLNDPGAEAKALSSQGSMEILIFRYREALRSFDQARKLASQVNDTTTLGMILGNISVVYSQLGDFRAADDASQQSVSYLENSPRREMYALALLTEGDIAYGLDQQARGKQAFREALAAASDPKYAAVQATVADSFGIWLVLTGDLGGAEQLLTKAYKIRSTLGDPSELAVSNEHLAELEIRKGSAFLPAALAHINAAMARRQDLAADPWYYPLHTRAVIELGLGKTEAALADFRAAVREADQWRQSALPGDATSTRTVAQLSSVYQDCADLLASESIRHKNPALAEEAFDVIVRNRAASLREQITRSRQNVLLDSPEYFDTLQQLQEAQAAVTLGANSSKAAENRARLDSLRGRLHDLENRLGLAQQIPGPIGYGASRNFLKEIQQNLRTPELLLSFSLGQKQSYLWTISRTSFHVYALPPKATVTNLAHRFGEAVRTNQSNTRSLGPELSRTLLGPLPSDLLDKPEWLIVADGELQDKVPFAALPSPDAADPGRFLITSHNLRFVPSELLTAFQSKNVKTERFIGVGDPIYNRADNRWKASVPQSPASHPVLAPTVARLVGSERELTSSAKASKLPQVTLLTGPYASTGKLRAAITPPPQILHFAVHVLSPKDRPGEAALALSLTKDNLPELLTAEAVATYRVPGSMVVLSGCASQQGEIVPSSGLVGLSRSWMIAGAEAVIVSSWPTPDDTGLFFSTFYRNYAGVSGTVAHRAAMALQQTQLAMQQAGGFRSDASYWAAYSIVSKE